MTKFSSKIQAFDPNFELLGASKPSLSPIQAIGDLEVF